MKTRAITLPELGMIAGTRAALGAGVGLLLASHLKPHQRRMIGWSLVAAGVLSTIPLGMKVLSHGGCGNAEDNSEPSPDDAMATAEID
jgi:hypothetical protein